MRDDSAPQPGTATNGLELPGKHSALIRAIVEDFGVYFVPGGVLIYVGDTGERRGYFDVASLAHLASASTHTASSLTLLCITRSGTGCS